MKIQNTYFGIDIGATKTIFLLVEIIGAKYKILESAKIPTQRKEKEILKMAEDNYFKLVEKYQSKAGEPRAYKISGVGIGFCGPVDFERGIAIKGPNLKTGKIEFKKILEKKLKIAVAVENDARCFTLAENIFGAAKNYKNVVGLTIGTGIGGGIIISGEIYRGTTGSAGEFGHINIEKTQEWEAGSSGSGLANIYKKLSKKNADSFEIVELAKNKDKNALKSIETIAENLGIGIANIIETFDPEIIVLGGGLSEVKMIMDKAKKYAKKKVFLPSLVKTPIVVSKLGQNAVALGAAWMASRIKNNS